MIVFSRRSRNPSVASVKELMRRTAQTMLGSGGTDEVGLEHLDASLDDMLFSGGALNLKLLGGAVES